MTQEALTRKQIKDMKPGSKLDMLVATKLRGQVEDRHRPGNILNGTHSTPPKEYSKDMNAAWEVEALFDQATDLREAYAIELHNVMGLMLHEPTTLSNVFQFAHATPEQRCKAMLLAVLDL
ncbi:hypothetical protein D3C75_395870 [compost metagenome]